MPATRALRLAHRGDWRRGPENSLEAFRAALANPACDGLEFDVRLSRDALPVILHDVTLARVQRRDAPAASLAAAELGAFGVPTLDAVLAETLESAFLDVELKEDAGEAVVAAFAARRGRTPANTVVSSFELPALETMARLAPSWPRWLNAGVLGPESVRVALELGCRGISAEWHSIEERSIVTAREQGLEVAAWTIRRRSTFERLARLGVAAVCVEGAALAP